VSQPGNDSGGSYDNNGNMTSSAFGGGTPTSMTYNNVDQLTSSTASGTPTYSYDANGNRLTVSGGNSTRYNWLDQTSSTTPYGGSAINATYAGGGQSERLTNGATRSSTSYQYDATGLSTSTDSSSKSTTFVSTPDGEVISEQIPVGYPGCTRAGGGDLHLLLRARWTGLDHGPGGQYWDRPELLCVRSLGQDHRQWHHWLSPKSCSVCRRHAGQ